MYKQLTAAAALALLPLGASAAVIDLTDPNAYDTRTEFIAEGTIFGGTVTWTISGTPDGSLTYTAYDGPAGATGGGAEVFDGVGIADDEVSATPPEYLHLEFSESVTLDGLYFLDLFADPNPESEEVETALVWFGGLGADDDMTTADLMIQGTYDFPQNGGFHFEEIAFSGTKLTFGVMNFNDGQGVPDYALAGISVVPLPASAFLLLAGVGGLGAMRRFRKS